MSAPRHRILLATAAAVLVLAGGCGSSEDGTAGEPPATTATTAVPTTETTATPETTAPAPAEPTGLDSPQAAAERLYETWKADDRASAALVAEQAAVDGMWATPAGDYALYNQCDSAEFDTSGCLFRGNPGTVQLTMERRGEAWVVIFAMFSEPGTTVD